MVGQPFIYKSRDEGDPKYLKKITAPKTLILKVGCPVILLRNISPTLVNGLRGHVNRLEEDGPTVSFEGRIVKLGRESFSVYDPTERTVRAERLQFPISLSFAITIHKSQGMTLPYVTVNCRNIFQPGQLGVAVGRSVTIEGLSVRHFSPSCCKPHRSDVVDYMENDGLPPIDNLTCCREVKINHLLTDKI